MKKLIAMLLCVLFALGLCACGSTSGSSSAAADEGPLKIAYSTNASAIAPLTQCIFNNLQAAVEAQGWEFTGMSAEGDDTLQAEQITSLLAGDPDYFVLFPSDSSVAVDWVKEISDAGVPVILIYTDVDAEGQEYVSAYVGPDNYSIGKELGQWLIDQYGAEADLNIVQIAGVPGQADYAARLDGFFDSVKSTNYTVLNTGWAYSSRADAQALMENYLMSYGDSIDVLVALDDDLALGGLTAIAEAESDVKVISIMGMIEAMDAIEKGGLSMTVATPTQSSVDKVIEVITALENGETVDYNQYGTYQIITADNAADYQAEF